MISALYTCAEKKSSGRYDGDLEVPIFFDNMRWEPFAERAATPSLTSTFGRRGEFHRCSIWPEAARSGRRDGYTVDEAANLQTRFR